MGLGIEVAVAGVVAGVGAVSAARAGAISTEASGASGAATASGRQIPSIKEQASELIPLNAGRNGQPMRSPSIKVEVDLAGAEHGGVPTPHTKVSVRNLRAPNQPAYNTKGASVEPATQQDIRTVRRFLERQPGSS